MTNSIERRLNRLEGATDAGDERHPGIIFVTKDEFDRAYPDGMPVGGSGRGLIWVCPSEAA
jgi:hypothetical protein